MRFFVSRALWLSSVVTAELITITEHRKCSTSAVFPAPTFAYNTTVSARPSSSSTSSSAAAASTSARPPLLGGLGPGSAASTPQSNKVDFLFWLEFANAIRTAAEVNTGDDTAFFVGGDASTGPLAGDNIDQTFTNQGIYQIANMLLSDTSIYYQPGTVGYVDALSNYLDNVDLEIKTTEQQDNDLYNWSVDLKYAHENTQTQKTAAIADYKQDKELGLTNRETFAGWVLDGNANLYTTAQQREDEIASKINQLQLQMNGPKSAALKDARERLGKARSDIIPSPGYTMLASTGSTTSPALLKRCLDMTKDEAAKQCPKPSPFNVPAYEAQGYREFVQAAQKATIDNYTPGGSASISVDSSKQTSQYNFGQTSVGADVSGGWFSPWSASGKHTTTSQTFSSTAAASSVQIKVTWDSIRKITITPGSWNFNPGDFKLHKDAPAYLRNLVRPTQLIVATRVGYEITVGDELRTAIDTHYKETTEAGGGFRIFGIRVGASASHTEENETHEATWNSAGRSLVVKPKDVYGAATLLGIVGTKIAI